VADDELPLQVTCSS